MIKNKLGQEEMVGFGLIIIIVAVIMLILLAFALNNSESKTESYEAESFVQAILDYTSTCEESFDTNYRDIERVIKLCANAEYCEDGKSACDVLENTLEDILNKNWKIGKDSPYSGYKLDISSDSGQLILIEKGNFTNNQKGSIQQLDKINIIFEIYS